MNRAIILRLFLPSATSSHASPVHSYGGHGDLHILCMFYYLSIIILTDYRLEVYRWREFGDITTYGSYYELGLGHQRALASELLSSARSSAHRFARCAAPRFTPPLLRQSIPTAVTATFYPFYSSCSRDFSWVGILIH